MQPKSSNDNNNISSWRAFLRTLGMYGGGASDDSVCMYDGLFGYKQGAPLSKVLVQHLQVNHRDDNAKARTVSFVPGACCGRKPRA